MIKMMKSLLLLLPTLLAATHEQGTWPDFLLLCAHVGASEKGNVADCTKRCKANCFKLAGSAAQLRSCLQVNQITDCSFKVRSSEVTNRPVAIFSEGAYVFSLNSAQMDWNNEIEIGLLKLETTSTRHRSRAIWGFPVENPVRTVQEAADLARMTPGLEDDRWLRLQELYTANNYVFVKPKRHEGFVPNAYVVRTDDARTRRLALAETTSVLVSSWSFSPLFVSYAGMSTSPDITRQNFTSWSARNDWIFWVVCSFLILLCLCGIGYLVWRRPRTPPPAPVHPALQSHVDSQGVIHWPQAPPTQPLHTSDSFTANV